MLRRQRALIPWMQLRLACSSARQAHWMEASGLVRPLPRYREDPEEALSRRVLRGMPVAAHDERAAILMA
jgi:hypothetical protein